MAANQAIIREQIDPQEVADSGIEAVTCDKCGAPETPSNQMALRQSGISGYGAFINEGPPEWDWICDACVSEDEVPY
jgi:hypothetical protein